MTDDKDIVSLKGSDTLMITKKSGELQKEAAADTERHCINIKQPRLEGTLKDHLVQPFVGEES